MLKEIKRKLANFFKPRFRVNVSPGQSEKINSLSLRALMVLSLVGLLSLAGYQAGYGNPLGSSGSKIKISKDSIKLIENKFNPNKTMLIKQENRQDKNHKAIFQNKFLKLSEKGKFKSVIVIPPAAYSVLQYSAEELKKYLDKTVGGSIEIVNRLKKNKINIVLGFTEISRKLGVKSLKLPRDAYIIKYISKNNVEAIIIAGIDDRDVDIYKELDKGGVWGMLFQRATLFGIYDFLERFIDVGFYFPNDFGTPVQKAGTVIVQAMDIYEAPDFTVRSNSYYFPTRLPDNRMDKASIFKWASKERLIYKESTEYIPNCSGLSRMGLVKRFGRSHPEYFSLLPNGQRSLTGKFKGQLDLLNKGLADVIYKDFISYLKGEPASVRGVSNHYGPGWDPSAFQPGYVNCMLPDGFGLNNMDRSSKTLPYLAKFKKTGSSSDYVWRFVARIAKRIKDSGIPGKVTAMAYSSYREVPDFPLPDNIIVQLAIIGPWGESGGELQKKSIDLIDKWNKKLGGPKSIYLWNYMNNYNNQVGKGIPPMSMHAIASFYKKVGNKITGATVQQGNPQRLFQYLNMYVMFKIFWDNKADVNKILNNHYRRMFGPAAKIMQSFYSKLEELWMQKTIKKLINTPAGPRLITASDTEKWNSIYGSAQIKKFQTMFEQAEKICKSQKDYAALSRVEYIRINILNEMIKARQEFLGEGRDIEDLIYDALPVKDSKIKIDGNLKEKVWENAPEIFMVAYKKNEGSKVKTSVRVLWSKNNLYIGVEAFENKVKDMLFMDRKRDDPLLWKDSDIEIFLNPSGDRTEYYQFIVNPKGSISDYYISGPHQVDISWNSKFEVKTRIYRKKWVAEFKIPLKDIKAVGKEGTKIVANFCRSRYLKTDKSGDQLFTWSPFLQNGFHDPERFGTIRFVKKLQKINNLLGNGSFEESNSLSNAKDWTLGDGITIDSSTSRDGKNSLKITDSDYTRKIAMQYIKTLKPKTKYLLTFFSREKNVKLKGNTKHGGAYIQFFTDKNRFYPREWMTGTIPWTKYGFTFKTGSKTRPGKYYLRLGIANSIGTVWFDDVRVREVK